MATRTDNTFVEFLQKLLKQVTEGKLLQDADMPWLVSIETQILDRAKKPVDQLRSDGVLPPTPGSQSRGGVMGMPNMAGASDEMRRMLAPGQGAQ